MGEAIFYIVCAVALGIWMWRGVKKAEREYVSWIADGSWKNGQE